MHQLGDRLDGLAGRATAGITVADPARGHDRSGRRSRALMVACAAVAVIGGVALVAVGRGGDGTEVELGDISSTVDEPPTSATLPATSTPAAVDPSTGTRWLLPDSARWAPIGVETTRTDPTIDTNPVWAWEVNGGLMILTENVDGATARSPIEATPDATNNRVLLAWRPQVEAVGVVGIDLGVDATVALASTLRLVDGDWELPSATPLLDRSSSVATGPEQTEVWFAPVIDGTPTPTEQVSMLLGARSRADAYRTLFELSGLGEVRRLDIGGSPAFVVESPMASSAIIPTPEGAIVLNRRGGGELVGFVESLMPASEQDWDRALGEVDTNRTAALDAELERRPPPDGQAPSSALPRYLLPADWELVEVFDTALWSADERARWTAELEANERPRNQVFVRQALRLLDADPDPFPVEVPDVIVQVVERRSDTGVPELALTFDHRIGDLAAALDGDWLVGHEGDRTIVVRAPDLTESEIVALAADLRVTRVEGQITGVEPGPDRLEEIYAIDGDELDLGRDPTHSRWLTTWRRSDGAEIRITGSLMDEREAGFDYLTFRDGQFTFEALGDGVGIESDLGPGLRLFGTYDPDLDLQLRINLGPLTTDEGARLVDQLQPIDFDEWAALATPLNRDPDAPRQ